MKLKLPSTGLAKTGVSASASGSGGRLWSDRGGAAASDQAAVPTPVAAPASVGEPPAPVAAVVGQVLPIYFVGDESHSMAGDPIAAVNRGLIDLRDEVAKHPLIGKKVRFGIITFADTAQTRLELSELSEARREFSSPPWATRRRSRCVAARSRRSSASAMTICSAGASKRSRGFGVACAKPSGLWSLEACFCCAPMGWRCRSRGATGTWAGRCGASSRSHRT